MKKILVLIAAALMVGGVQQANAQFFKNLVDKAGEAAKRGVENRVTQSVENGVDKALDPNTYKDAIEKGKEKKNNNEATEAPQSTGAATGWTCPECGKTGNTGKFCAECGAKQPAPKSAEGWTCPECGHQGNTGKFCGECGAKQPGAQAAAGWTCPECGHKGNTGKFCDECGAKQPGGNQAAAAPAKKVVTSEYVKCDFVPGDEVFFEDLVEGEQLGEFPSKWDLIGGNAEVAKIDGNMCISLPADAGAEIEPLMTNQQSYLPEMFTVEMDFYRAKLESSMGYIIRFADPNHDDAITITISGQYSTTMGGHAEYFTPSNDYRSTEFEVELESDTWHHLAISFNKRALKVYINGKRVANIPNCVQTNRMHILQFSWGGFDDSGMNAITNVRLAKGAVPLYDRLASEGKIITYAITFETGKADLKPESMVEIMRIAKLMQENPNLSFEVQGHCDATGSDKVNDPLSQKRAEAIVAALAEQGIASARLTAVGKGSHEPIASNSTDEGRAKNRRVEFVKK